MQHTTPRLGGYSLTESGLWLSDNTIANVSTTKHGLAPKLPNDATKYLDGSGAYSVPGAVLSITFLIDGGGAAIATGVKGDLEIPFGCTINAATLLGDQIGSIVLDIWKDTYANFPPTVADTITASAKPTLASSQKSQDTTLTGWTTAIGAGDVLRFNVDSATTVQRVTLSLKVTRT